MTEESESFKKYKLSEEHRRKISERVITEEWRRKISEAKKGKKHTEETKRKMSESRRGEKNHFYGKHHTEETKKKLRECQLLEKGNQWKGDNVGRNALHERIRKIFSKPDLCMLCKKDLPIDLACITEIYDMNLKNWAWLCKSCHCKWDNKAKNFL